MQSQVYNSPEFLQLLSSLIAELVDAEIHFKLHQDLVAAYSDYSTEFNQSWTFWSLTINAHLDAAVLRLCKAYDQYDNGNGSLNLRSLLKIIRDNLHLFEEPLFRERLKNNPYVDSLAATTRKPDSVQLKKDVASVENSDPLVKKLTIWRNNYYSHLSFTHASNARDLAEKYPFSVEDIRQLLTNGLEIVNRYNNLFNSTLNSTMIVGHSDYKSVLEAVRDSLAAHEARIQEEFERFK